MTLALARIFIVTVALGSAARAGQTCVSASVPVTSTNWTQTISIPRFGSMLGVLTGVRVQLGAHVQGSVGIESLDTVADVVSIVFSANIAVTRPDTSTIVFAVPMQSLGITLTAFDGLVDFGGTSGHMFTGLSVDAVPSPSVTLSSAPDLALFTGPASNPGVLVLNVNAFGTSIVTGSPGVVTQFISNASAVVTVCYDYEPAVTSYCAGTNAACPCANGGFLGAGCRNSGVFGARLVHYGLASLSADTLVLESTSMPAGTNALFVQGTTRVNGGSGSIFGDGLLCVGGTLTRLAIKPAPTGSAQYPGLGDTPLALAGGVAPGAVRTYQAWYRDGAAFCTSDTFNLTQGLEVTWVQ